MLTPKQASSNVRSGLSCSNWWAGGRRWHPGCPSSPG